MVETKSSSEILSTEAKRNGFHAKYLEICKSNNIMPLPEVKMKDRNIQALDFHADRVRCNDWIAICKALENDKTLKFIAIRLRKNNLLVLNAADTLKKAKTIVSHPVIYSKFLLGTLVDALKHLVAHSNMLETLILEGLPLNGIFMQKFILGLTRNTSIKTLDFSRSPIGDVSCESVCTAVKLMMNIETINFSGCDLGIKGAEAVAGLVKLQKIQRFSEAWAQSLRYQNIDAKSFSGLRKILLNNNTEIGDEGLEHLMEVLLEDVWVKDIEMQNCGLTDEGARSIIKCLNTNKTIVSFNVAGNPEMSEHLYRHIVIHLCNADQDTSDSCESGTQTKVVTKAELLEEIKFFQEQLEQEIYRRKQMELLHEKLKEQLEDAQKQMLVQGSLRVPDGFTLVANETLNQLLKDGSDISRAPSHHLVRNQRKRRAVVSKLTKSPSCVIPKAAGVRIEAAVKSETLVKTTGVKLPYLERSVGDQVAENRFLSGAELMQRCIQKQKENTNTPFDGSGDGNFDRETRPMSSEEIIQCFSRKPRGSLQRSNEALNLPGDFDPRTLFTNSPKRVPNNSDVESDSSTI